MEEIVGGLETGGTWMVAAVGTGPDDVRAVERYPTTTPAESIARAAAFFAEHGPVARVGIAAFGPVDLDPASPTWGSVARTPKPGWSGAPLAPPLADALGVEVRIDTDVNAAALGEHRWGAGQGSDPFAYVTVGTGLGAGILVDGRPVHGRMHPELGHLRVPRDPEDTFPGACPFHGDCLEGLASGTAIAMRWGSPGGDLPDDHRGWALEARYLAHGVIALTAVLSPPSVVLSGGVGRRPGMLEAVAAAAEALAAGYFPLPRLAAPALGDRAGVLGAIALAQAV